MATKKKEVAVIVAIPKRGAMGKKESIPMKKGGMVGGKEASCYKSGGKVKK